MSENKLKVIRLGDLLDEYEKEQKENADSLLDSLSARGYHNGLTMAKAIALKLASDDSAVVVRCQKCIHWKRHTQINREYGLCRLSRMSKHENGYCDLGKVLDADETEDENEANL